MELFVPLPEVEESMVVILAVELAAPVLLYSRGKGGTVEEGLGMDDEVGSKEEESHVSLLSLWIVSLFARAAPVVDGPGGVKLGGVEDVSAAVAVTADVAETIVMLPPAHASALLHSSDSHEMKPFVGNASSSYRDIPLCIDRSVPSEICSRLQTKLSRAVEHWTQYDTHT